MRVQNEGTGKSSWWVLNPDAKPGKTPRRRAGSMETKSYEKRRGRVKKKVEAVRAAMENMMNGSPSGEDFLSDSPLGFQLSPEFRPRASSNASSCGRLSPIQAANEPDLHDSQVPPMSPIPWGSELDSVDSFDSMGHYDDQLVDTLVGSMKLGETTKIGLGSDNTAVNPGMDQTDIDMLFDGNVPMTHLLSGNMSNTSDRINLTNVPLSQFDQSANSDNAQYRNLPAPPAYPGDSLRRSPQQSMEQLALNNSGSFNGLQRQGVGNMTVAFGNPPNSLFSQQDSFQHMNHMNQLNVNTQQQMHSPARSPQSHQQASPNYGNFVSPQQSPQNKQISPNQLQNQVPQPQQQGERSLLQRCLEAPTDSLLRAALTQKTQGYRTMSDMPTTTVYNNTGFENLNQMPSGLQLNNNGLNNNLFNMPSQPVAGRSENLMLNSSGGNIQMIQQQIPQQISMPQQQKPNSSNSLNEIDPDFFETGGFDMEQILQNELSIEGNLDFNFEPTSSSSNDISQNLVR